MSVPTIVVEIPIPGWPALYVELSCERAAAPTLCISLRTSAVRDLEWYHHALILPGEAVQALAVVLPDLYEIALRLSDVAPPEDEDEDKLSRLGEDVSP